MSDDPDDWFERALDETTGENGHGNGDDPDADEDGALFDEDFASAFGSADAPPADGGSGRPDAPEEAFDEPVDSAIPRIDLGIEGLDAMIQGGVPERSLIVTIGGAGTGKTTFGLQFLHEALRDDESAIFITLEQSGEELVDTAVELGWPFDEYNDDGRLAVVDLDPIEMATSLGSIRNDLPRLIEEFDATRLVLDSVSLLEMMYDDSARRRNEIYDFTTSLKEAGVTTLLTSEADAATSYASRYGTIEYLTDAVILLQYIRGSDFRETRLGIEIQKIRNANHSREMKPYEIGDRGISVYQQANLF